MKRVEKSARLLLELYVMVTAINFPRWIFSPPSLAGKDLASCLNYLVWSFYGFLYRITSLLYYKQCSDGIECLVKRFEPFHPIGFEFILGSCLEFNYNFLLNNSYRWIIHYLVDIIIQWPIPRHEIHSNGQLFFFFFFPLSSTNTLPYTRLK